MASDQDLALLGKLLCRPREEAKGHPEHYRDCCIIKPWGHEFEMYDDGKVTMWMLCLKPGQSTSFHCHQKKSASFIPVCGDVTVRTLDGSQVVPYGESAQAGRNVFHAISNPGESDVYLLEIESPSCKLDLIRAEDGYGRSDNGYEGEAHIVRDNLAQYNHVHFGDKEVVEVFDHEIIVIPGEGFFIRRKV